MVYFGTLLAGFILGVFLCFLLMWKLAIQVAKNKDRRIAMFQSYFYTLNRWMTAKRVQEPLGNWLVEKKQVHTVALYGLGILGRQFVAELAAGPVKIAYAIDQNVAKTGVAFPVFALGQKLPQADLVIVTPSYDFDTIRKKLEKELSCPIVSAEALIKEYYGDGGQS